MRIVIALFLAALLFGAADASAQETGKVGLTAGYPGNIGLIVHATPKVAVRPDFQFSRQTSDTATGNATGVGVAALFYFARWESVSAYFSPRYGYTRSTTSGSSHEVVNTTHSLAGSVGAQYSVGKRFGVYAEAGFGWTRYEGSSSAFTVSTNTANGWSTRTAVGGILYF